MTKKERYAAVCEYFSSTMPVAVSELEFRNTFELLVAVILSAQCTDKRINMVTPALFAAFPTPAALAKASVDDVLAKIRSVSYPKSKAEHLCSMARALVDRHGGEVPSTRAELEALAGVGRKTASVVLSVAFAAEEIAVDTHVFRVAHRLGLAPMTATTPLAVERHLVAGFSPLSSKLSIPNLLGTAHHWLILHGRYTCTARAPRCSDCDLHTVCNAYATKKLQPSLPKKSARQQI